MQTIGGVTAFYYVDGSKTITAGSNRCYLKIPTSEGCCINATSNTVADESVVLGKENDNFDEDEDDGY